MLSRTPPHAELSTPAPSPDPSLRRTVIRFGVAFALLIALFQAAYILYLVETPAFRRLIEINTHASAALLRAAGVQVAADGVVLSTRAGGGGGGAVEVKRGCDGLQPIAIFVAGVLAFPAPWRKRLPALAVGIPVLLAVNLVRIATLALSAGRSDSLFQILHEHLWPAAFIFLSLAMWLVWAVWSTRPLPHPIPPHPTTPHPGPPHAAL